MQEIRKKIVTDDAGKPIAVQIAYGDWLEIEQQLGGVRRRAPAMVDLMAFSGKLKGGEEPLAFQHRMREEWER
ncbi:MAG TPA: hypothetical protein PKI11_05760 [Candidatus Hydrogenedentes bacterium]|nr:hypothetical protein [Candidatus Hydrogenedentota bacterium]HNT87472.1 hypothetical protein [Candidatus Hydrogenedentota bacterium]